MANEAFHCGRQLSKSIVKQLKLTFDIVKERFWKRPFYFTFFAVWGFFAGFGQEIALLLSGAEVSGRGAEEGKLEKDSDEDMSADFKKDELEDSEEDNLETISELTRQLPRREDLFDKGEGVWTVEGFISLEEDCISLDIPPGHLSQLKEEMVGKQVWLRKVDPKVLKESGHSRKRYTLRNSLYYW